MADVFSQIPCQTRLRQSLAVWLSAAAIVAVTIAAFRNSLHGEFMFDDQIWIVENPSIRHLWPLTDVLFPADAPHVGGRPVVSLTLALNYHFAGDNGLEVGGYHATNMVIHAIVALLLFGVVRRTVLLPQTAGAWASGPVAWASAHASAGEHGDSRGLKPTLRPTLLSLAVALIWAVHPLQTEAVSYVIQRAECLLALFYLLTLYAVIRGATTAADQRWRRAGWYLLSFVACLLGMATKEVMVTAPLVVLLYDAIFLSGSLGRTFAARRGLYAAMAATWGVLAWVLATTNFHAETTGFGVLRFTPWQYLCIEPSVLVMYLRLALWPDALCFAYDLQPVTMASAIVIPGLIILGLLAATGWALAKRLKIGFLGAAFFLILAPTSSFIPILDAAFEHRMYLPLAPLIALVTIGGYWAWEQTVMRLLGVEGSARTYLTALPAVAVLVAIAVLAWLTIERNRDYESEFSIWRDTAAKRPNNPRAHYNLARALSQRGEKAAAMAEYRETLRADPNYPEAYQNLGGELALQGKFDEAIPLFERAIAVKPEYAEAHFNLGLALAKQARLDLAIAQFRAALEIKPGYWDAHYLLGRTLALKGNVAAAAAEVSQAIKLKPRSAPAHAFLALLLTQLGRLAEAEMHAKAALTIDADSADGHAALARVLMLEEHDEQAIASFRKAIEADPKNAQLHFYLGEVLMRRGQVKSAVGHWRTAAALQPDDIQILYQLAWTLATSPDAAVRNGPDAVASARRASLLAKGQNPAILAAWAAGEAEIGQFPKAVELAERAIELAGKAPDQAAFVAAVAAQIKLYESGRAFRGTGDATPQWQPQ